MPLGVDTLAGLLLGLGTFISGFAAVMAVRAKRAVGQSPAAMMAELRAQVTAVVKAHDESSLRWRENQAAMELALRAERKRADDAQKDVFTHLADVAGLRLDLANAQLEISKLRADLDALTSLSTNRP